jgi:hypothetical protein
VDRDRERFAERTQLEVDLFGQLVERVRRQRHVLAQAAGAVDAIRLAGRAEVVVAGPALRAREAHGEQLERDTVARREARDAVAERGDFAGALVAEHEPRRHRKVAAVEVQVAAAHADVAHPHQHLARRRLRLLDVLDLEGARARDGCLFHAACLQQTERRRTMLAALRYHG